MFLYCFWACFVCIPVLIANLFSLFLYLIKSSFGKAFPRIKPVPISISSFRFFYFFTCLVTIINNTVVVVVGVVAVLRDEIRPAPTKPHKDSFSERRNPHEDDWQIVGYRESFRGRGPISPAVPRFCIFFAQKKLAPTLLRLFVERVEQCGREPRARPGMNILFQLFLRVRIRSAVWRLFFFFFGWHRVLQIAPVSAH